MNASLKKLLWSLRRLLGLSPTQKVFRELRRRGVRLSEFAALETFGATGNYHTWDYASQVARLDIWEIDSRCEEKLRSAFPTAEIRITDSYEEMRRCTKKYDLIVVDNPEAKHGSHYEHFDMIPEILRLAYPSTILITTIRPGSGFQPKDPIDTFDEGHLARRRAYFRTDHPEQLTLDAMIAVYKDRIKEADFEVEWFFHHQRTQSYRLHYLVLSLRKSA